MDTRFPGVSFESERENDTLMIVNFGDKVFSLEKSNTVINYYPQAPWFANCWHFNTNGNRYIAFDRELINTLLSRGADLQIIDGFPGEDIQEAFSAYQERFAQPEVLN